MKKILIPSNDNEVMATTKRMKSKATVGGNGNDDDTKLGEVDRAVFYWKIRLNFNEFDIAFEKCSLMMN